MLSLDDHIITINGNLDDREYLLIKDLKSMSLLKAHLVYGMSQDWKLILSHPIFIQFK